MPAPGSCAAEAVASDGSWPEGPRERPSRRSICTEVHTMKKSTRELVIRRDTLRALAQLDLVRVAGGNPDAQRMDTDNPETGCPLPAAVSLIPACSSSASRKATYVHHGTPHSTKRASSFRGSGAEDVTATMTETFSRGVVAGLSDGARRGHPAARSSVSTRQAPFPGVQPRHVPSLLRAGRPGGGFLSRSLST